MLLSLSTESVVFQENYLNFYPVYDEKSNLFCSRIDLFVGIYHQHTNIVIEVIQYYYNILNSIQKSHSTDVL